MPQRWSDSAAAGQLRRLLAHSAALQQEDEHNTNHFSEKCGNVLPIARQKSRLERRTTTPLQPGPSFHNAKLRQAAGGGTLPGMEGIYLVPSSCSVAVRLPCVTV